MNKLNLFYFLFDFSSWQYLSEKTKQLTTVAYVQFSVRQVNLPGNLSITWKLSFVFLKLKVYLYFILSLFFEKL